MSNISLSEWRHARKYIIKRLIDTFIREHISIFSKQEISTSSFGDTCLTVKFIDLNINVMVKKSNFLQHYKTKSSYWTYGSNNKKYSNIIFLMRRLYHHYGIIDQSDLKQAVNEYKISVLHHVYKENIKPIPRTHFFDSMSYYDYLASYADHPLYPTARAKVGFSHNDLIKYAPEYSNMFKLNWIAVKSNFCQLIGLKPSLWPKAIDLGFDPNITNEYEFIPVHPFARKYVENILLTEGIKHIVSDTSYLEVVPTLSVRTVSVTSDPSIHIKLPLNIRTLSTKNIRTIKPSTINDGSFIQELLQDIVDNDLTLKKRLILSNESCGGHVNDLREVAYIIRRYPQELIQNDKLIIIPVAALSAIEKGSTVINNLVKDYFDGDLNVFLSQYINLMLSVHLRLVLHYGIALEANQQNTLVVLNTKTKELKLLLKDNDAPRININQLYNYCPKSKNIINKLQDRRIIDNDRDSLYKMFNTIIWQLNIACIIENLIHQDRISRENSYQLLCDKLETCLKYLNIDQSTESIIIDYLCKNNTLDIKYLYTSGTFLPKKNTSDGDINKFYGSNAPNFLKSCQRLQKN
ncbi:MAG: siderophore synthetase component [Francisellaceae bacterium]|jgi:siderophore synthetase component